MKYFHRTSVSPDEAMAQAAAYFGARLTPTEEGARRRRYTGSLGEFAVTVQAEGGHYTLVTVGTNQPGESEADKFAKRFLTQLHTLVDPDYAPRGAY